MPKQDALLSFDVAKKAIELHFNNASQRTFVSTPIAGAPPLNALSDHLPIEVRDQEGKIIAISANLLSDQHIYNTFVPLANKWSMQDFLLEHGFSDNIYIKKLHMFFYELAEYSRKHHGFNSETQHFIYDDQRFDEFLSSDFFFNAKDLQKAKLDRVQIGEWIKKLPYISHDNSFSRQDISLTIAHAFQILHHIEYGGLKYDDTIMNSRAHFFFKSGILDIFSRTLEKGGFVNLQECTNPQFILDHLGKNCKAIVHNTAKDGKSLDNCMIIYNTDFFDILSESTIQKFTLGGPFSGKPAIIAAFNPKDGIDPIIVGSVHHPGGEHQNELPTIIEKLNDIRNIIVNYSSIIITGDFNHTPEFFTQYLDLLDLLHSYAPTQNTMGGPDFRGIVKDKIIDFALANISLNVTRVEPMIRPEPAITADTSITVRWCSESDDDAASITLARPYSYFSMLEQSQTKAEIAKNSWKIQVEDIEHNMSALGELELIETN